MGHVYTAPEITALLLDAVADEVQDALTAPGLSTQQRLQAVAQGILGIIDGAYPGIPVWILSPHPDPDYTCDQAAAGEDYYPLSELAYGVDVAGTLAAQYGETI